MNNREKPNHKLDQYGFQIDGPVIRNIATKADQNISDKTRMYVRYAYNKRTEQRSTNGVTSGPAQDGQLPLWRINQRRDRRSGSRRSSAAARASRTSTTSTRTCISSRSGRSMSCPGVWLHQKTTAP